MACSELRSEALAADAALQESIDIQTAAYAAADEAQAAYELYKAQAEAAQAHAQQKGEEAAAANTKVVQDAQTADKAFARYYACVRGE